MAPIKFDARLAEKLDAQKHGHILPPGYLRSAFFWATRSYRQSVDVSAWLSEQYIGFHKTPLAAKEARAISSVSMSPDERAYEAFVRTWKQTRYVDDNTVFGSPEHWQTAEEVLASKKGDCEDGATRIAVTGWLAGIPAHRLKLAVVEVENPNRAGEFVLHAVAVYRPSQYPGCWAFLDWCYYPEIWRPGEASLYMLAGNKVERWARGAVGWQRRDSKYRRVLALIDYEQAYVPNLFGRW